MQRLPAIRASSLVLSCLSCLFCLSFEVNITAFFNFKHSVLRIAFKSKSPDPLPVLGPFLVNIASVASASMK